MANITQHRAQQAANFSIKLDSFGAPVLGRRQIRFDRKTHIYAIRDPQGHMYKIGESAMGVRVRDGASKRAEFQVRCLLREKGAGFTSEIRRTFDDKFQARIYEVRLILRFRKMFGIKALPGNKVNR